MRETDQVLFCACVAIARRCQMHMGFDGITLKISSDKCQAIWRAVAGHSISVVVLGCCCLVLLCLLSLLCWLLSPGMLGRSAKTATNTSDVQQVYSFTMTATITILLWPFLMSGSEVWPTCQSCTASACFICRLNTLAFNPNRLRPGRPVHAWGM